MRFEKANKECLAKAETNQQQADSILGELRKKHEVTLKERDELEKRLEAYGIDAGDQKFCLPFSTQVYAEVTQIQSYIYLLDKGRIGELKEMLNLASDGFVGILETMVQTSKDEKVITTAKKTLVRIAKHRKEYPPPVGEKYPGDPEATKRVALILEKALKEYQ